MKRIICCMLAVALLLSGCSVMGERLKEPVTFYYLRTEYPYGTQEAVIATEEREAAGHRDDLSYLMALYLMGPTAEDLRSPIPRGTRIYSAQKNENTITLQMSETEKTLTDAEYSLVCACLSLTCFGLSDADIVTITSGERSLTLTRDTITLIDNTNTQNTEDAE